MVLSKPVASRVRPLLWTFLSISLGAVFLLPGLAIPSVRGQGLALDGPGWLAVLYLWQRRGSAMTTRSPVRA